MRSPKVIDLKRGKGAVAQAPKVILKAHLLSVARKNVWRGGVIQLKFMKDISINLFIRMLQSAQNQAHKILNNLRVNLVFFSFQNDSNSEF